jgi:hypothetical protein
MAPIITAALLVFRPKEATNIARTKIHNFAPRKTTPSSILEIVSDTIAISSPKLRIDFNLDLIS